MHGRLDDAVSIALALAVTAMLVVQTVVAWPDLFELHKFPLERDNPIPALFQTADR